MALSSVLDLVNELVYDKVDAILVDGGVAEQYAAANPDLVIADASSELPAADPYCIAVAKGDPKGLLDGINAALAKMASRTRSRRFIADADALADVAVEVSADSNSLPYIKRQCKAAPRLCTSRVSAPSLHEKGLTAYVVEQPVYGYAPLRLLQLLLPAKIWRGLSSAASSTRCCWRWCPCCWR